MSRTRFDPVRPGQRDWADAIMDAGVTLAPDPSELGSTVARVLARSASRRKVLAA